MNSLPHAYTEITHGQNRRKIARCIQIDGWKGLRKGKKRRVSAGEWCRWMLSLVDTTTIMTIACFCKWSRLLIGVEYSLVNVGTTQFSHKLRQFYRRCDHLSAIQLTQHRANQLSRSILCIATWKQHNWFTTTIKPSRQNVSDYFSMASSEAKREWITCKNDTDGRSNAMNA